MKPVLVLLILLVTTSAHAQFVPYAVPTPYPVYVETRPRVSPFDRYWATYTPPKQGQFVFRGHVSEMPGNYNPKTIENPHVVKPAPTYPTSRIPDAVMERFVQQAQASWPNQPQFQEKAVLHQIEAFQFVESYRHPSLPSEVSSKLVDAARRAYPDDYVMQKGFIDRRAGDLVALFK
jgi:hypothetical protein